MQPVTSIDDVYEVISKGKKGGSRFLTNLFPDPVKMKVWIDRQEVFIVSGAKLQFLLRKDENFFHLYFCAPNSDALIEGLNALTQVISVPLSADLIGTSSDVEKMAELFESCRFQPRTKLQRLIKIIQPDETYIADSEVSLANEDDAGRIRQLLLDQFDPYAEQIPSEIGIATAAGCKGILVIRKNGIVVAFLFSERTGQTSVIRYWLVDDTYSGSGVGSKLMRTFLAGSQGLRQVVLWVVRSNHNAITKYTHYGFQPDRLIDQVMVKGIIENG